MMVRSATGASAWPCAMASADASSWPCATAQAGSSGAATPPLGSGSLMPLSLPCPVYPGQPPPSRLRPARTAALVLGIGPPGTGLIPSTGHGGCGQWALDQVLPFQFHVV